MPNCKLRAARIRFTRGVNYAGFLLVVKKKLRMLRINPDRVSPLAYVFILPESGFSTNNRMATTKIMRLER